MTQSEDTNPPRDESAPVVTRVRDAINSVNLLLVQAILEQEHPKWLPPALARKALSIGVARGGSARYVDLLLAAGADPSAPNSEGETPLFLAVWHQNTHALEALLKAGADPNVGEPKLPLRRAVASGSLYMTDLLILAGARTDLVDLEGANLLHHAVQHGYVQVAERLLEAGISPNRRDNSTNTALNYAIRSDDNRLQMLDLLIQHGADVNVRRDTGATPAQIAAVLRQFDSLERLVAAGADPYSRDGENRNALWRALEKGDSSTVCTLLEHYPGFAPTGEELDAALVLAVRKGSTEAVQIFAKMGADLGQKPGGRTLAQCAPPKADGLKRLLRSMRLGVTVGSAMSDSESEAPPPSGPGSPIL